MKPIEQEQITHIEELIERFFEGVTSNEEESELSLFFSEEMIPPELLPYKPIFTYFETRLEQECRHLSPMFLISDRMVRLRRRLLLSGAAACLLIFLSIAALRFIGNGNDNFDPYEGSFIVKNGVKITDLNQIRPELEATMERVLYKEHKAELEFLQMEYEQQSKYVNLINSFPEGPIRQEVMMSFQ